MECKLDKIIKRNDGTRVKIEVSVFIDSYGRGLEYRTKVFCCAKRKRSWFSTFNVDSYSYRSLNIEDRKKLEYGSQLDYVSEIELHEARTELWRLIRPSPPQTMTEAEQIEEVRKGRT